MASCCSKPQKSELLYLGTVQELSTCKMSKFRHCILQSTVSKFASILHMLTKVPHLSRHQDHDVTIMMSQ